MTNAGMTISHKNKTFATFLAAIFGGLGLHRFYLYGKKDVWGWIHVVLFPLSIFAAFVEALVIGLTPDDKWDVTYNSQSGRHSDSGWPLVILLVFTFGGGAIVVIAAIARGFDLMFTGGAYG